MPFNFGAFNPAMMAKVAQGGFTGNGGITPPVPPAPIQAMGNPAGFIGPMLAQSPGPINQPSPGPMDNPAPGPMNNPYGGAIKGLAGLLGRGGRNMFNAGPNKPMGLGSMFGRKKPQMPVQPDVTKAQRPMGGMF